MSMRFRILMGLALAGACQWVGAADLDEIRVVADRQPTSRDESTNPVRMLARDELDLRLYDDVTEALATLPNVNIRRSGGPDGEPSLGMYGISARPRSSTSTTLAIDGVPLNNGVFPEASLNILPLSVLERIEVVQGPASAAYGNNARLGVVNLVTRQPKAFGGEVSASYAKWDTASLGGYLGGGVDGGGRYLVGFEERHTDGHLQPAGRSDFSDSRLHNLAGFVNRAFGQLLLSASYVRYGWDRNDPSYLVSPGSPAASNPRGTPTARYEEGMRQHFNLGASYSMSPEWQADLIYAYNDYDERTAFNPNYGTPTGFGSTAPTDQSTRSHSLIARASWESEFNVLSFGAERQTAELTDRVAYSVNRGTTTGIFVHDRLFLANRQLILSAGYRSDRFSFFDETSKSPKAGFVWKPNGQNWLLRGNVSKAFSAPSFNQLFGSFGNPKLVATTLAVRELGVEFRPAHALQLGATIFSTRTTDPIFPRPRSQNPICAPGPGNCFVNAGDVATTRGVTLDFRARPTEAWSVGGSYTRLDPGENTFATAVHVIKLDAAFRRGPWTLAANLRREIERYFQDNHLSPFPDFTVVDASLSYRFDRNLELSGAVENLTNEKYATTQIVSTNLAVAALPIYRPERYLGLRASYRF